MAQSKGIVPTLDVSNRLVAFLAQDTKKRRGRRFSFAVAIYLSMEDVSVSSMLVTGRPG